MINPDFLKMHIYRDFEIHVASSKNKMTCSISKKILTLNFIVKYLEMKIKMWADLVDLCFREG